MKIKDLFTDESKWTQYEMARDKTGKRVYPESPDAVCWCLEGALIICYGKNADEAREARGKLRKAIGDIGGEYIFSNFLPSIYRWNDFSGTTFAMIKELVTRADV